MVTSLTSHKEEPSSCKATGPWSERKSGLGQAGFIGFIGFWGVGQFRVLGLGFRGLGQFRVWGFRV